MPGPKNMPDDDDDIVRLKDRTSLFGEKYQQAKAPPPINSTKQAIEWLDKSYATIILNGRFRVLHEKPDGTIEFMEQKDFISNLRHMKLQITGEDGKIKSTPISELWLNSPSRRMYNGITFDPSRDGHYDGMYNLWKGWKIVPKEGDVTKFTDYMRDVICSGNVDDFNFLAALVSDMFQRPHMKPGVAVVLRGEEGVGKSFFVEKLGKLAYPYYFKTSNPQYIFGDHNGQLKDKIMLHLEEAVWAGSKKDESLLKDLITGQTIEINDKFIPVYSVPNHLHLFITGNPDWLVSARFKARRIFALHASEAHIRDTPYFKDLDNWFHNGGAAALMYFFMNHKSDIDLRLAPITDELVFQKQQSMSGVFEWWNSILDTKEFSYGEYIKDNGHVEVIKKLLYVDYMRSPMGKRTPLSDRGFGMQLMSLLPAVVNGEEVKNEKGLTLSDANTKDLKIRDSRNQRRDGYNIPDLPTCRRLLERKLGGKIAWSTDDGPWTVLRGNTEFDFKSYEQSLGDAKYL